MKIVGMFSKRQFFRYLGLAAVLLLLVTAVCAGAFGRFLCPFQAEGNYRGLGVPRYGSSAV